MYTRQEASRLRQKFWTSFGQYMRPLKGASGETVNWVNYKTGIRHIFFRMDATVNSASIAIELQHPEDDSRAYHYEQLVFLKKLLEQQLGEEWTWEVQSQDDNGGQVSRISKSLEGVSVFRETDWPSIISFLKPRIIALDQFWWNVKDSFE